MFFSDLGILIEYFVDFFPRPFSPFRVQILFQFSFSNIRRVCGIDLALWFSCFSSFLFIFSVVLPPFSVLKYRLEFDFFFRSVVSLWGFVSGLFSSHLWRAGFVFLPSCFALVFSPLRFSWCSFLCLQCLPVFVGVTVTRPALSATLIRIVRRNTFSGIVLLKSSNPGSVHQHGLALTCSVVSCSRKELTFYHVFRSMT